MNSYNYIPLSLSFLFYFNVSYSQKETDVWCFGYQAAINFNSGSPIADSSAIYQWEGCSSIADSNGNLLFYTNGVTVWNSSNLPMPNGFGLKGNDSSTQSALIAKKPGSSILYYIFTAAEQSYDTLFYSIVDITLNGGMGDVAVKNVPIPFQIGEKLSAVKHGNGNDIWIAYHGSSNNAFYVFLLSATGFNSVPVISNVGSNYSNYFGQMKFSPNGNKIASAVFDHFEFFDFDNLTGIISHPIISGFVMSNGSYGVEYSSDGSKIYGSSWSGCKLVQYDLNAGSDSLIIASQSLIYSNPSRYGGSLQLASNGKIYMAIQGNQYLSEINNPTSSGISCNFLYNSLFLNGKTTGLGLPNFISNYFSSIVNIDDLPFSNEIVIYPNPFCNELHISGTKKGEVLLYNVTGKEVIRQSTLMGETIIPTEKISSGFYVLHYYDGKRGINMKLMKLIDEK